MKYAIIAAVFLGFATVHAASEERTWHFLSKTEGGTVSLIKDLTKSECDHLLERYSIHVATISGAIISLNASTVVDTECFQ